MAIKKRPELLAEITEDFNLQWSVPSIMKAYLKQIGVGKKVRVDIARWYKKRTSQQNRTAWGPDYKLILRYIAENVGEVWSEDELHDFHKRQFLGFEESVIAVGLLRLKSTTRLNTLEFAAFREEYCKFWSERGLYIPDPKKQEERMG